MNVVLAVPLGITSIIPVMLQPIALGAWRVPCLATAPPHNPGSCDETPTTQA